MKILIEIMNPLIKMLQMIFDCPAHYLLG